MGSAALPGRLCTDALAHLPVDVSRPAYLREQLSVGIVHLGLGAFHRAHQAMYTDALLARADHRHWGIAGVCMTSDRVHRQLAPQDGLYSVTVRSAAAPRVAVIGAVREVLVWPQSPAAVLARIAATETRIVSLTVTEKAYGLDADSELDTGAAAVLAELRGGPPRTVLGLLADALRQRRINGAGPLSVMSCDNLQHNGTKLRGALLALLAQRDQTTRDWVAEQVSFPTTMVDRIVPATTDVDLSEAARRLGCRDAGAVATEAFSQWVIEDDFAAGRPAWESVGAALVADVAPFEQLKLRLLNGSHSAIAYFGSLAGRETVADVMATPLLARYLRRLMTTELRDAVTPPAGFDVDAYVETLLQRFANPGLAHRCHQIAMDGSQKIPQRWLPVLRQLGCAHCPLLVAALSAWLYYATGSQLPLADDPIAGSLLDLRREADARRRSAATLALIGVNAESWKEFSSLLDDVIAAQASLQQHGVDGLLQRLLDG